MTTKTIWKLHYSLDKNSYCPLEFGTMKSTIHNVTNFTMLVTKIILKFEWMGEGWFYQDCNVKIAPKGQVKLLQNFFK